METKKITTEELLIERARNIKILNASDLSEKLTKLKSCIENFRNGYGGYSRFRFFDRYVDKKEDCISLLVSAREQLKEKGYEFDSGIGYKYNLFTGRCVLNLDLTKGDIFDRKSSLLY